MNRPRVRALALVAVIVSVAALAACAPEGYGQSTPAPSSPSASSTGTPTPSASPTPTPTGTAEATPAVPTDCRAILSEGVLSQLGDTPLNDPALGIATGVQSNGSLVCVWRDPRADTTGLETTISKMSSGPALDMLNALVANEQFSCFTPDKGTRCEKTWQNDAYPVTDGRTLFYRSGILIDTKYSNLAPSGYTDAIVAHLFG
jgi:hypothetical protein